MRAFVSLVAAHAGFFGLPVLIVQAAGVSAPWYVAVAGWAVGFLMLGWLSFRLDPTTWQSPLRPVANGDGAAPSS